MKRQSEIKILLIVALIAVVVSVAGILLLQEAVRNQVSHTLGPAPSPQPQTLDTSMWQTYRNEEFGVEFRYPSNWNLSAQNTSGRMPFLQINASNFQHSDTPAICDDGFIGLVMQVGIQKRGHPNFEPQQSFEDFVVANLPERGTASFVRVEPKGQGWRESFRSVKPLGSRCEGFLYAIEQNEESYTSIGTGVEKVEDQQVIDAILSTFRFVEPEFTTGPQPEFTAESQVEGYMDIDISTWSIYRDEKLGFEFQFPVNNFIRENIPNEDTFLRLRSMRPSNDGWNSSLVTHVSIRELGTTALGMSSALYKRLDFASLIERFGNNVRGDFFGDPPRGTYIVAFAIPGQNNKEVIFSFDIHQLNEPGYGGSLEDEKTAARILSTFRFVE